MRTINTPLEPDVIKTLSVGENVLISGEIITARDAAHKRLVEMIKRGDPPPFYFEGAIVFYAGPSKTPPGHVIGSIGPTTSGRMDDYSVFLIEKGLKAMIGKGERSDAVARSIQLSGGVYFTAIGGIAALLSQTIKSAEIICFEDLCTEAVRRLVVENFPVTVAIV